MRLSASMSATPAIHVTMWIELKVMYVASEGMKNEEFTFQCFALGQLSLTHQGPGKTVQYFAGVRFRVNFHWSLLRFNLQ